MNTHRKTHRTHVTAPWLLLALLACGTSEPADSSSAADAKLAAAPAGVALYGAPISDTEPIELAVVLDAAEDYDGSTVLLEGPIAEVCQNKGCWMLLVDGDREMRVTFKDYGFFVPMDCAGRRVVVEGVFSMEEVPVEEARHYLEDAGRDEEAAAITAPVPSYVFEATGVRLLPSA